MSHEQLIDLHARLQRKLSASTGFRYSGRVDRLALALREVEAELRALESNAGRTGFSKDEGRRPQIGSVN